MINVEAHATHCWMAIRRRRHGSQRCQSGKVANGVSPIQQDRRLRTYCDKYISTWYLIGFLGLCSYLFSCLQVNDLGVHVARCIVSNAISALIGFRLTAGTKRKPMKIMSAMLTNISEFLLFILIISSPFLSKLINLH